MTNEAAVVPVDGMSELPAELTQMDLGAKPSPLPEITQTVIVNPDGSKEIPEALNPLNMALRDKVAVFTKECEELAESYGVVIGIAVHVSFN